LAAVAPDVFARTDCTQRHRILRALEIARSRHEHPGSALPPVRALLLAPFYPRGELHRRIEARLDARLALGLVAEVSALHEQGLPWERLEHFGLEYRWVARFLQGHLSSAEMRNTLLARIRQFCRSQEIWFRKMEREGWDIHWLPGGDSVAAESRVRDFLAGTPLPRPQLRLSEIYYGPTSEPHRKAARPGA
jgi:tRNA dimethylallyltransferase